MRTTRQTAPERPSLLMTVLAIALIAAFVILPAYQLGWLPDWMFGPGAVRVDTPATQPHPTVVIPLAPPAVQPQAQSAPVVPTAYVPAVQEVQYQAAPPADVPVEAVQERTEMVQVDRSEEQTTIIRTVPNKPSGPVIVVDKGKKCMGVCK